MVATFYVSGAFHGVVQQNIELQINPNRENLAKKCSSELTKLGCGRHFLDDPGQFSRSYSESSITLRKSKLPKDRQLSSF